MVKICDNNRAIFLFFFFVYLTIALSLVFYNENIFNTADILFGTDCQRVMGDFVDIYANHVRVRVHPFILIQLQPVFAFFDAIIRSPRAAVLIVQAIVSAVNVCLIKSVVYNFTNNKNISFICALIFGFSFSTLIFTIAPENYVFSALFNILLLHYISFKLKEDYKLKIKDLFVLAFLSAMAFGVIPVNIVQCLILTVYFLIKKLGFKKEFAFKFLIFSGFLLVLYLGLSLIQKGFYPHSVIFFKDLTTYDPKFLDFTFTSLKFQWILKAVLVEPFYPAKCVTDALENNSHYFFSVDYQNPLRFVPALGFWLLPFVYFLKNLKENINKDICFISLLIIGCNALLCFFYDTRECFLFSQNYLMFFPLFLGCAVAPFKGRFFKIICSLFLIFITGANFYRLYDIQNWLLRFVEKKPDLICCFIYSLITVLIFATFSVVIKKIIKKEFLELDLDKKYFIYSNIYLIYMIICAVFVGLFHAKGV